MTNFQRFSLSLIALMLMAAVLTQSQSVTGNSNLLLTPTISPSSEPTTTPPPPALGTVAQDLYGVEMVYVPAGTFEMGISVEAASQVCIENFSLSEDEDSLACLNSRNDSSLAPYEATLRGFWIDRYEVSNEQYQNCIDEGHCEELPAWTLEENNTNPQKPVVGVTWYDALLFCTRRGARLPTEEEWEYAASGPNNNVLPSGTMRIYDHILSTLEAHPVGSFSGDVSWVGAYDMAYNVSEWVEDRFVPYPSFEGTWSFLTQSDLFRVVRGGAFDLGVEQTYTFIRQYGVPEMTSPLVGIRCARSSDPRP